MKNNMGNMNSWQENNEAENNNKFHIKIKTKSKSPLKKTKNNDEGEYVDYTEIK